MKDANESAAIGRHHLAGIFLFSLAILLLELSLTLVLSGLDFLFGRLAIVSRFQNGSADRRRVLFDCTVRGAGSQPAPSPRIPF